MTRYIVKFGWLIDGNDSEEVYHIARRYLKELKDREPYDYYDIHEVNK